MLDGERRERGDAAATFTLLSAIVAPIGIVIASSVSSTTAGRIWRSRRSASSVRSELHGVTAAVVVAPVVARSRPAAGGRLRVAPRR